MRYVERRPCGQLRGDVECLWAVWDDEPVADRSPERIVPDGCPELILHLGDAFARLDRGGSWQVQSRAFLAGTLSRPWTLLPGQRPRTVGIRFRPGAAPRVLGVPMGGTSDRETGLGALVGAAAAELEEAVLARGIGDALAVAEGWMIRRRRSSRFRETEARPAVRLILGCRGAMRIHEVACSLGWSRRRLERAFAREVGISPKRFARIVRLNGVLASLEAEAERSRAVDLALEAGYFDQSHLLRDFRDLAGAPPSRLGGGELSRQLVRPERLQSLLAGE